MLAQLVSARSDILSACVSEVYRSKQRHINRKREVIVHVGFDTTRHYAATRAISENVELRFGRNCTNRNGAARHLLLGLKLDICLVFSTYLAANTFYPPLCFRLGTSVVSAVFRVGMKYSRLHSYMSMSTIGYSYR